MTGSYLIEHFQLVSYRASKYSHRASSLSPLTLSDEGFGGVEKSMNCNVLLSVSLIMRGVHTLSLWKVNGFLVYSFLSQNLNDQDTVPSLLPIAIYRMLYT